MTRTKLHDEIRIAEGGLLFVLSSEFDWTDGNNWIHLYIEHFVLITFSFK